MKAKRNFHGSCAILNKNIHIIHTTKCVIISFLLQNINNKIILNYMVDWITRFSIFVICLLQHYRKTIKQQPVITYEEKSDTTNVQYIYIKLAIHSNIIIHYQSKYNHIYIWSPHAWACLTDRTGKIEKKWIERSLIHYIVWVNETVTGNNIINKKLRQINK